MPRCIQGVLKMAGSAAAQGLSVPGFEESDRYLRKSIGFKSLLSLSIGATIGSGFLCHPLRGVRSGRGNVMVEVRGG